MKPYNYGNGKNAIKMIEKAKKENGFLTRNNISDDTAALKEFVDEENLRIGKDREAIEHLKSPEYINEKAAEIEEKRK